MAEASHPLRIFLCHSSDDKQAVRDLYQRLRADGFDPWLDEENLLPGQDWQRKISEAVDGADVVLVCLSRSSITRKGYVQKEIKFALDVADKQPEDTIYLVPLKLEECDIPERLRRWHSVNLFEPAGYNRLQDALGYRIASILANPVANNPQPSDLSKADRERPKEIQRKDARRLSIKKVGLAGLGAVALLGIVFTAVDAVRRLRATSLNTEIHFVRAHDCDEKKDYDCAIENYSKVIEGSPRLSFAYYQRGLAYASKGNYDLAIKDYDKVIRLNPKDANAYLARAKVYEIIGQPDKASSGLQKYKMLAAPQYGRLPSEFSY